MFAVDRQQFLQSNFLRVFLYISEKIRIRQGIAEGQMAASNSDIMAGLCENFQTKFPTSEVRRSL